MPNALTQARRRPSVSVRFRHLVSCVRWLLLGRGKAARSRSTTFLSTLREEPWTRAPARARKGGGGMGW